MGRDARSDRSRGGPIRSLGNRETEPFGEAGVAPVIHVQPIRRYEPFERQMFSLVPMPHEIEAAKMINALLLCDMPKFMQALTSSERDAMARYLSQL
jgi:hypothetical protein